MGRITRTEHGARLAYQQAVAMIEADFSDDLFPQRLPPQVLAMWLSISDAAELQMSECRRLREALHA